MPAPWSHAGPVCRRSNLAGVRLLGRRNDGADDADGAAEADAAPEPPPPSGTTAPKGRPTPKRNESAKRRGPVAPAPLTTGEARKRRKEMRATMTKEERQAEKQRRRAALATRRERMMAGEEAFMLPRDRGPVRRYIRDIVDSRRNLLGLFMPAGLTLIFMSMAIPRLQLVMPLAMLMMMLIMVLDAIFLARKANRAVDAKFPDNTDSHFKLGMYAVGRASQLRRMRAPRPQVSLGDKVA